MDLGPYDAFLEALESRAAKVCDADNVMRQSDWSLSVWKRNVYLS